MKIQIYRILGVLLLVIGTLWAQYTCTCSTCSDLTTAESQCATLSGTYSTSSVTAATCSDISCVYYVSNPCRSVCSSFCANSASVGCDHASNYGDCSDKEFTQCAMNIGDNDGDWAYCDMCMCENYDSYGGDGNCGADEKLYACYISSNECKSIMRQSWIIGFVFIGCALLTVFALCPAIRWCKRHQKEKTVPLSVGP